MIKNIGVMSVELFLTAKMEEPTRTANKSSANEEHVDLSRGACATRSCLLAISNRQQKHSVYVLYMMH